MGEKRGQRGVPKGIQGWFKQFMPNIRDVREIKYNLVMEEYE